MPWSKNKYPVSMKNLPEDVRDKAIEIANALLEKSNMSEGMAIATAIKRAKQWVTDYKTDSAFAADYSDDYYHI